MPRPRKWRKVCCLPNTNRFGPLNGCVSPDDVIQMTVDEYETIRLIDLEGMNQEDCTGHMNVARTTVQGIYNEARRKLALSLVEGRVLFIEGGDYHLCDGQSQLLSAGRLPEGTYAAAGAAAGKSVAVSAVRKMM